ncbi:unnamed protein product [Auanema sp. JU1783]|nr:unnamed protein product [Auanema sp. JU1783]
MYSSLQWLRLTQGLFPLKSCPFQTYDGQPAAQELTQCNSDDYFCKHCVELGTTTTLATTYHANQTCHMAFDVTDNNTVENVGPRCEQAWANKSYNAYCQLSALPNATLATTYLERQIRNTNRRMFIALFRDNCTSTWNWKARDGTITFASNRTNPDCNVTIGAFDGTQILDVNPKTFQTNAFTCQCVARNGTALLPGAEDNASPSSRYMLLVVVLTSLYAFF